MPEVPPTEPDDEGAPGSGPVPPGTEPAANPPAPGPPPGSAPPPGPPPYGAPRPAYGAPPPGPPPYGAPPPAYGAPPPAYGAPPPAYGAPPPAYGAPPPAYGAPPPAYGAPPPAYGAPPPAYGAPPPAYGAPPPAYPSAPPYGAPGYGAPAGYGYPAPSPYASYWARVGGWLLDFVILTVVNNIVAIPLNASRVARVNFHFDTTVNGTTTVHRYHYSVLSAVIALIITLLYGAIMCGSARGQTFGMMVVGARAVDGDNGGPIGFGRALWRAFFEYLMLILCFIPWVLDMLWPAWDSRGQAWHDKVSNTVVVRRDAVPA